MKHLSLLFVLLSACQVLPGVPSDSAVPVATTLVLVEAPADLAAGEWTRLSVQVLDQSEQAMAGQVVTAAVLVPEGEAPGVVPGLGNTCRTGVTGEACPIPIRSEGPVGDYAIVLTTGSVSPVEHTIQVSANPDDARLIVAVPEQEPFFFVNGQPDGLKFRDPLRVLAGGEPLAIELVLIDAFDNPISAEIMAEIVGDAAGDQEPIGEPNEAAARISLSLGSDCSEPLGGAAQSETNEDGQLVLCLAGGAEIGEAKVGIRVPGVLKVEDGTDQLSDLLVLPTQTVPSGQLRLVVEGQPELRCAAGDATQALSLRVLDAAEPPNPVPGQEVRTASSGLAGVLPDVAVSGLDGRLVLRAQCPLRRSESPELIAYLADDPSQALTFPVEIQIGAVDRVEVHLDNAAPGAPSLRVGTQGVLRFRLFDVDGNTVPEGAVTLSFDQVLEGALRLAAPACDAPAGDSLNGLTCIASGDGEVLLEVLAGGALPGVPVVLTARGHKEGARDPKTDFAFELVTGQAAQLSVSPNGRMAAVVGADAGTVSVRISDTGGNPIAGIAVGVSAPDALLLSPATISQDTNAEGWVSWRLAQVQAPGAHELSFTATAPAMSQGEQPIELAGAVTVDTSIGQAAGLQLRNLDGDIVAADQAEQAWVLGGAVGEAVPGVYTLERINGRGGVLTGAGGLALAVRSEPSAGCAALANLASAQFNEAGALRLGDGLALRSGTVARSCRYRLSVGGVHHDLVLNQTPGAPVGGTFERNVGTLEAPVWQEATERLDPRPGYAAAPGGMPLAQTHHVRLRNPQDAFGNALAAGTVLQPAADNAFVVPEVPVLRAVEGGTAIEFAVAGGANLGADAVVTASSAQGWQQAPSLRFEARQDPPFIQQVNVVGIDRKTFPYSELYPWHGRVQSNGVAQGSSSQNVFAWGSAVSVDRFAQQDLLYRPADNCTDCVAEDPVDGLQRYLATEHEAQAQLVKLTFRGVQRALFEQADGYGRCAEGARCSRALITWVDDGRGALDRPQILGRFPLQRVRENGLSIAYHAYVPIALLSGGGVFGAAIETDAGEGEVLVSNVRSFTGHLRPWLRPRQLKVLAPPPPAGVLEHHDQRGALPAGWRGFARTLDVQRIQADHDDDEELLICGDDAFGGWVAIAHVDEARAARGANPFGEAGTVQAVRTYLTPGFLGDPNSDEIPFTKRFVTGVVERPTGCSFVPQSPMGAMVLSFGRPGSDLYPGVGDLVATPVQGGAPVPTSQAGLAQRQLPIRSNWNVPGEELAWGSWAVEGGRALGALVDLGNGIICRMAATQSGEGLALAAGDCGNYVMAKPAYPAVEFGLNLTGTRDQTVCTAWDCQVNAMEVSRSMGRLLGVTDWGGEQGLLRFARHTPYVAWYLPHRYDDGCEAQAGRMVCPQAVCGDGQLSYGEVCERGAGCTDACRLVGYEGERPPAGLAVSFAPMQLHDVAGGAPEVTLTHALAASPLAMKMDEASGALQGSGADNMGRPWNQWYTGRANCRRLGGDLPSERQWEGIASGGAGGAQQGARPFPWGNTANTADSPAAVLYRSSPVTRGAAAWLGVTPEGLSDLTSRAVEHGEWTLADQLDSPSGENPQSGPSGGNRSMFKGGGTSRRADFPVRARSNYYNRSNFDNGSSRCVWLRPRP